MNNFVAVALVTCIDIILNIVAIAGFYSFYK